MPNTRDFLEIPELVSSVGVRNVDNFRKIAAKAGVLDFDISTPEAQRAIDKQTHFNWIAFVLGAFWGIYYKLPQAWILLGIALGLVLASPYYAPAEKAASVFGLIASVVSGLYGSSWLFAKQARNFTKSGKFSSPSWISVFGGALIASGIVLLPVLSATSIHDLAKSDCEEYAEQFKSLKLKNNFGGEFSIVKLSGLEAVNRSENALVCTGVVTLDTADTFRATLSVTQDKDGQQYIQVQLDP